MFSDNFSEENVSFSPVKYVFSAVLIYRLSPYYTKYFFFSFLGFSLNQTN